MWGGGAAKMETKAIPPPQEAELSPKSADSGGVTRSHHGGLVPEGANRPPKDANRPPKDANRPPSGRQVDAKEVT